MVDLSRHLVELDALDPGARGAAFEALVTRIFELAQFDVVQNAGSARPRQTDLVVRLGNERYLVEVKHQARPADIEVIDSLRARLRRTDPKIVGVVISRSGFTSTAITDTEDRRDRPVLLVDGDDIERVAAHPEHLRDLLSRQYENLVTHGRRDPRRRDELRRPLSTLTDDSSLSLMDLAGQPQRWLTCSGSYSAPVSALELLDIDWTPTQGLGVTLDAHVPCGNQPALVRVLERLAAAGWITATGAWTIEQADRTWHGIGAPSLVEALEAWTMRFRGLRYVHHREIASFSDQRADCAWTLQADVQARDPRRIWRCSLSFRFPGVPLDTEPLRSMLSSLGVSVSYLHFRPAAVRALEGWYPPKPEGRLLDVTGYVVEHDDDGRVVRGVHAVNPFWRRRPRALPEQLGQCSHLILPLRSWHDWGDRPAAYRLQHVEWTRGTEVLVACSVADWDDPLERCVVSDG